LRGAAPLLLAIAGCGAPSSPAPGGAAADAWVEPAPAVDLNAAPDIVEVNLEARAAEKSYRAGPATTVWSYNGTVPGPLIEGKVGDTLIVHFKNSLPEPTTIHWHGLRVPNAMDGVPAVHSPIDPGGTFTYQFQLEDAGLFWFHPHFMSDEQVEKGLYGVVRVRGPNEPVADAEHVVVLDDVLLDQNNAFVQDIDDDIAMLGREGNVLLVNGKAMPALELRRGAATRLRLVSAANGRFYNLALAGHTFHVIGTDGGLLPQPYDTDRLLIAPGERYDVMLVPQGEAGAELSLIDEPYERGHGTGKYPPVPIAKIRLTAEAPLAGRTLPSSFPAIDALPAGPADATIVFNEQYVNGKLTFTVDGKAYPDVPPIDVTTGAVKVLDLKNDAEMDHPFHLHGFFFQVLARNGVPEPAAALANKDTLILPMKTTTRIAVRFDEPGQWMYHCHILEHAERGMMGEVHVGP
jgi:FtsP/CotA-like multicopper oxidase with cupredoxin domain